MANELDFTKMQWDFIQFRAQGFSGVRSAELAGYKNPTKDVTKLLANPKVQAALNELVEENKQMSRMTREKVMGIVTDAVDVARAQSDPTAMIRGAQELNKMCGYYAPEEKRVFMELSQKEKLQQLETMTDEELLELAEQEKQQAAIEGEFEVIKDNDDGERDNCDRAE